MQNLTPVSFRARLRAAAVGNAVRVFICVRGNARAVDRKCEPLDGHDPHTYAKPPPTHTHITTNEKQQQPNPLVALVDTGNSAMYLPEQIFGACCTMLDSLECSMDAYTIYLYKCVYTYIYIGFVCSEVVWVYVYVHPPRADLWCVFVHTCRSR